jgi:hypothetical protein
MEITITHGEPKTPFFMIAFPKRSYDIPRGCDGSTIIQLQDDKNNKTIRAAYFGCFEFNMADLQNRDAISRLAYGVKGDYLKQNLMNKYPELRHEQAVVEFWILKRI